MNLNKIDRKNLFYLIPILCFCLLILVIDLIIPVGVGIGALYTLPCAAYIIFCNKTKYPYIFVGFCLALIVVGYFFSPDQVHSNWKVIFNRSLDSLMIVSIALLTTFYSIEKTKRILEKNNELGEKEILLQRVQRLDSLGRLAGGIAHDFNNKLGAIVLNTQLTIDNVEPESKNSQRLHDILDVCTSATELTKQLLAFGRKQVLQPVAVNVNEAVENNHKMYGRLVSGDISIKLDLLPSVGNIKVDSVQLEQVILNLIINARDALPLGGDIIIRTDNVYLDESYSINTELEPGDYVIIEVSDNGVGIPKKIQDKIFDPFFTTKPVGQGSGLGLASAQGIVKQSGGHIWLYSEEGHGTTIKVFFPLVDEKASVIRKKISAPNFIGGSGQILLVEDDLKLRKAFADALINCGYDVTEIEDGDKAVEIIESGADFDIVITDMVMPGTNGPKLAEIIRKHHPEMPIVFMSGYSQASIDSGGNIHENSEFLQKPFSIDRLTSIIHRVLNKAG